MIEYLELVLSLMDVPGEVWFSIFSLGGNKSKGRTSTDSQSSGFDFSAGQSTSATDQQGSGFDVSRLFGPQSDAFEFLFPQAQQLAQQQLQQSGGFSQELAGQLGQQGQGFLDQLAPGSNPFLAGLSDFTGQGGVQGQIDALSGDITGDFQRGLVPIGEDAAFAGARGGSRQGIAQGLAAQGATESFARESANIRSGAEDRRLQALLGGGGLSNQLNANNQQAAGQGLQGLGGLFDLGIGGLSGAFSPLESLAGLVGPILERESGQQSTSTARGQGSNIGFGQNQQSTQSRGKTSGGGFNIGF